MLRNKVRPVEFTHRRQPDHYRFINIALMDGGSKRNALLISSMKPGKLFSKANCAIGLQ
jgi:hypothetical protein